MEYRLISNFVSIASIPVFRDKNVAIWLRRIPRVELEVRLRDPYLISSRQLSRSDVLLLNHLHLGNGLAIRFQKYLLENPLAYDRRSVARRMKAYICKMKRSVPFVITKDAALWICSGQDECSPTPPPGIYCVIHQGWYPIIAVCGTAQNWDPTPKSVLDNRY